MGWEMGRRLDREGTSIYMRLIHVDVWQNPTQHRKAIILQLKINFKKKKKEKNKMYHFSHMFANGILHCSASAGVVW